MRKRKRTNVHLPATRRVLIDEFDLTLLKLVQQDNLRPLREMAAKVHLSAPAVGRRLQRLRAERVILRDVALLDPTKVGRPLTIIVEVDVHNEQSRCLDEVRESFLLCPAVQQCYYVTGDVDFVLIMSVRDMEEYEAISRQLFLDSKHVRHFKTLVTMHRVKVDTQLPIE
jgi:Lrp/AsnC family leucine-responsive transcriptional regulator